MQILYKMLVMDLLKNYLALLIFGEKNNEQCKVISAIADNHS